MVHEKEIEIRWRDCDALGHVNNAVYATYLEECRDEWVEAALAGSGAPWDYVVARLAIDFRRELTLADDRIVATARLVRVGTSSIALQEQVLTASREVAAEAESVLVARDPETGRPRPLTDAERAALTLALAPE